MEKMRNNICNIIIVVLSVIFFLLIVGFCRELFNRNDYFHKPNSFYYQIKSGRYADMVVATKENRSRRVMETAELKVCYAVADYYEAATYYKAYIENAQKADAEKYLGKMKDCRNRMDDLAYAADDIDDKLKIDY